MIHCDEAGNSGENLVNRDQPVYVLASNDFMGDEAAGLLGHVRLTQPGEPKFTTLRNTERGSTVCSRCRPISSSPRTALRSL